MTATSGDGSGRLIGAMMRPLARLHRLTWPTRAVTLGVRAVVIDERGVLLVRHTYRPGWYLPGGAVDRGESAEAAVRRELREEGRVICTERPRLHGLYANRKRDHVACYVVRRFELDPAPRGVDLEIAEVGFFRPDALPEGTTPATRTRLDEVLAGQAVAVLW